MGEGLRNREWHESSDREISVQEILEDESSLESIPEDQVAGLIEKVQLMIIEVDPALKPKYRRLLQALLLLGAQWGVGYDDNLTLSSEYRVRLGTEDKVLRLRLQPIGNFSDSGINIGAINREKSTAYLLCITDEEKQCWINLKLFKVVTVAGTTANILYIADRYVVPALRGKRLGEQLLALAEGIAHANDCSAIRAKLVPENPQEMPALERGMQKAGFSIDRKSDEVIAQKLW